MKENNPKKLPKYVTGEVLWLDVDYYSGPVKIIHAKHTGTQPFLSSSNSKHREENVSSFVKDVAYLVETPIFIASEHTGISSNRFVVGEFSLKRVEKND